MHGQVPQVPPPVYLRSGALAPPPRLLEGWSFLMGKNNGHTEKSDDELLTAAAARFNRARPTCRQRFGIGKRKVCTLPKGHKGGHKQ